METSIYATRVTLSDDLHLLAANLVCRGGSPALTGHCLVDMMPQPDLPLVGEHFVPSGRQFRPVVGVSDLEPGDIIRAAHAPLLSVPWTFCSRITEPPTLRPVYLRWLRSPQ